MRIYFHRVAHRQQQEAGLHEHHVLLCCLRCKLINDFHLDESVASADGCAGVALICPTLTAGIARGGRAKIMLLTNQGEMASDRGGGAAAVLGEERQCGAWETGRSGFVHPSSQRLAYL
ncbi:hypothetical protein BRADI_4g26176v3 [Brachypodium distachyon]|uniref:Uncharacterized protein n=1 Tax=Brachypodium distachyon TaxID=15368 RepID=A0A2K2CQB7_BRADI|nr:hypothetical protein BRADI_4g26176v3 [Brachypodium distachyon]